MIPNGPPARRADPGTVVLLVESEPERFPGLRASVEETRAAGVQATGDHVDYGKGEGDG